MSCGCSRKRHRRRRSGRVARHDRNRPRPAPALAPLASRAWCRMGHRADRAGRGRGQLTTPRRRRHARRGVLQPRSRAITAGDDCVLEVNRLLQHWFPVLARLTRPAFRRRYREIRDEGCQNRLGGAGRLPGMVVSDRLLLGPGPSNPYPEVMEAFARPLLGHLDPDFLAVLDETWRRLRTVFRTDNALTLPMSGHRLGGHGDVLRQPDRARRHRDRRRERRVRRAHVRGRAPLRRRRRARRRAVGHAARSATPARRAARASRTRASSRSCTRRRRPASRTTSRRSPRCRRPTRCCSSTRSRRSAASPSRSTRGAIDAAYSGTQKCLGVPPGLSPVTFSDRGRRPARSRATRRRSRGTSTSALIADYVGARPACYHHTAPISMLYALHAGLGALLDEGLEAAWARHRAVGDAAPARACPSSASGCSSRGSPAAAAHLGVAARRCRRRRRCAARCSSTYDIEVGGGLGEFAGKAGASASWATRRASARSPRSSARSASSSA